MQGEFIESLKRRRSQYALGKDMPISQYEAVSLIQEAVKQSPSPFNSQSSRAIILFGAASEKLWNIAAEGLRKIVPEEAFAPTKAKLDSFAAGAGTVPFYEDMDVVTGLQEQYALYADNFPVWSEQSSGMAQISVWTALSEAGVGASLQHYNPLIDDEVAEVWQVPTSWKLRAQMPFGSNQQPVAEKTFMDDAARFRTAY